MENDILAFLTAPKSIEAFKNEYWAKKPIHLKANPYRKKLFIDLFNMKTFEEIVKDGFGFLKFGDDILAGRYKNGVRERLAPLICDLTVVKSLFSTGCTLQMVQPQRFLPNLQELCVRMESAVGCLVGCNAYLTPQNTQGLAPHHDDVELFICQTQGTKKWKLYEPIKGFILPNGPSEDLNVNDIGPCMMEIELEEGDVLYMPKGIIHQAKAQEEDSVHLTISTYQRWSWGDLLSTMISDTLMVCFIQFSEVSMIHQASSEPVCLPASLREELPLGFLKRVGRYVGTADEHSRASKELGRRLRSLADALEQKPEIIQSTADLMAYQFISSRMPPPDSFIPQQEKYPQLTDYVKLGGESYFRIMPVFDKKGKLVEDVIQVVSCLKNDIQSHMMEALPTEAEDTKEEILTFPIHHRDALLQIFNSKETGICVSNILLPTNQEKVKLVSTLWEEGIVYIISS